MSAAGVERYYSRGWYASLQPVVTSVSNRVPLALFDPLMVAVVAAVLLAWAGAWQRQGPAWRRVGWGLALTAGLGASLYLAFLVTWGLNYRREALSRRLPFDASSVTQASVTQMAERAVHELNRLHAQAHQEPWPDDGPLVRLLAPAFAEVQRDLGFERVAVPGRPKRTILGPYFRWTSVSGMTDPYFLEVMLTPDALPFERPVLLAHEWGHLAGFAHEAEAGFVGWATAMRSGGQGQYSAWLDLYPRLAGALPREVATALDRTLGDGPRADYRAVAARLAKASPGLRQVAWRSYDRFLKANRVAEGIASYDRVVVLIVGTRFRNDWTIPSATTLLAPRSERPR